MLLSALYVLSGMLILFLTPKVMTRMEDVSQLTAQATRQETARVRMVRPCVITFTPVIPCGPLLRTLIELIRYTFACDNKNNLTYCAPLVIVKQMVDTKLY
jgi:hypothetical protein